MFTLFSPDFEFLITAKNLKSGLILFLIGVYMKKVLLISLLVSVFVLQTYADGSTLENVENKASSKDFSVISSDFLVHTPLLC